MREGCITVPGVPLLALQHGTCRWPIGKNIDGVEEFCGGRIEPELPRTGLGGSYCRRHRAIAVRRA